MLHQRVPIASHALHRGCPSPVCPRSPLLAPSRRLRLQRLLRLWLLLLLLLLLLHLSPAIPQLGNQSSGLWHLVAEV
jgi:hypothetical protein